MARRAVIAMCGFMLVTACAGAVYGLDNSERFAAILYSSPEQMEVDDDYMRSMRFLLEDPMVGNFRLEEFDVSDGQGQRVIEEILSEDHKETATSFYYLFGGMLGEESVASLPGRQKVIILDRSQVEVNSDGAGEAGEAGAKPTLSVKVIESDTASAVLFVFEGNASEETRPSATLVEALRGNADANRDRKVTVAELAAFLEEGATLSGEVALGNLADAELLTYLTPADLAKELGADGIMQQARGYVEQQRWIETLLLLREVKKEKYTAPDYRELSELSQLNLSLEARYSDAEESESVSRDFDEGLDLISRMLHLTNLNYVEDVDNRDLFAGGARNLELFLGNRRLRKTIIASAADSSVSQMEAFLEETVDNIYKTSTFSEADFRMRVKRILMESDATVKLAPGVIITEFIYGISAALDPNTDFIPPNSYKEFRDDTSGHFGGLGIEITLEDKILTVITPLDGSPAADAGMQPGDRIIAIEGESTTGMTLMGAVRLLRGPVGTKVTITVIHRGHPDEENITIGRGEILLESVKGYAVDPTSGEWGYLVKGVDSIGYVRLTDFKEDTPERLDEAIGVLMEEGMRGLVLDLRFNHGGLLTSGVKVADRFLSRGTIVSVKSAHQRAIPFKAHYFRTYADFPVAILINEQSASAAEIVAGALKDNGRATLVGARSFGKGTVQTVYEVDRGRAAFKLTTGKYYTPSGVSIHREPYSNEGGLTPDIEVEVTDEENSKLVEVWHLRGLRQDARERLIAKQRDLAVENPKVEVTDPGAFVDSQLDEALDVIKAQLVAPAGSEVASER